jgi:hypothetical protein
MDKLFSDLFEFVFLIIAFFILLLAHKKKTPVPKGKEEDEGQDQDARSAPSVEAPLIATTPKAARPALGVSLPISEPLCQVASPLSSERKRRVDRSTRLKSRTMIISYEVFSPPLCMRGWRR